MKPASGLVVPTVYFLDIALGAVPEKQNEEEDQLDSRLEGQTAENPGGQFSNQCLPRC